MPAPKDPARIAEWKLKMSQSRLGRKLTPDHKRHIGLAGIGRHHSSATRIKMSKNQLGTLNSFYGRKHSRKTLIVIKRKLTGRAVSTDHRTRISQSLKGRRVTEHARELISLSRKGKYFGKDNPNWNGGLTPLTKRIRGCLAYARWRLAVFSRDGFRCTNCGAKRLLEADHYPIGFAQLLRVFHIRSLRAALRQNELWDIRNGRTLCRSCHELTHNYFKPIRQWQIQ